MQSVLIRVHEKARFSLLKAVVRRTPPQRQRTLTATAKGQHVGGTTNPVFVSYSCR